MPKTSIPLMALLFTSSFLLGSCYTQTSVSQEQRPKAPVTTQANSSSTHFPLRVQQTLANYKTYDNPEGLESVAELIVVGKPEASLEDSLPTAITESDKAKKKQALNESVVVKDSKGFIVDRYTITPVKVQKVLKGNVVEEKEIKVLQAAAVVQEPNQPAYISVIEDYTPLKKNSKYLLFLKEVDTATYPNLAGVYSILSVNQGKFNNDHTDTKEAELETKNKQYRELKEKVKKKYEATVDAVP